MAPAYFGTLLRRWELGDQMATETGYPAGLRLAPHAHRDAYICIVSSGRFSERYAKGVETYGRATCIFHPPNDEHANVFHEPARCVNVELSAHWLRRLQESGAGRARFSIREDVLGRRIVDELAVADALSPLAIEALIAEIVVTGERRHAAPPRQSPAWLVRARELIDAEHASPLSLSAIAAEAGVHPVHLARSFRARHGCTVGEYIRQARVRDAALRLAATDEPIASIAVACGFADQSQLTRTFKRLTGRTPGAHRALSR